MSSIREHLRLLSFLIAIMLVASQSLKSDEAKADFLEKAKTAVHLEDLNTPELGRYNGVLLEYLLEAVTDFLAPSLSKRIEDQYKLLFEGIDVYRMKKLGETVVYTGSKIVFKGRRFKHAKKDCEEELHKTMIAAGMDPTSGYVALIKGPVLRIIFQRALSEIESLELILRYFITVSALGSTAAANVHNVKEELRLHLDCYVEQLKHIYQQNHSVLAPSIVAKETIELINSISQGDSSHTPKFWY